MVDNPFALRLKRPSPAGKNRKLSGDPDVYSGDAVDRLRDAPQDGASETEEEAARTAVAIAWRKNGPAPAPPLSAVPASAHAAHVSSAAGRGGAGVGDAAPRPLGQSRGEAAGAGVSASATPPAAAALPTDDDRGLTFEQVQRKYEGKIYSLILRYVGDREDAEDLTVETFVNAWRHWDRFRGEARIYTWLYQIAINNCKNRFKQRDRRREREPVSLDDAIETDSGELSREVADWRNAPEQLLMDKEFAARVRRAVDALRPEYKEVFVLAEMEDMSYEDIARVTKLTVPAVKTRLHRARNMIRQRLEPYYRD